MFRAFALAAPLVLAACVDAVVPPAPVEPPSLPPENACGAADLQDLVGQSAARLETMRFAGPTRVIRPGMAVTMDYSASRLNLYIDTEGNIERVSCG